MHSYLISAEGVGKPRSSPYCLVSLYVARNTCLPPVCAVCRQVPGLDVQRNACKRQGRTGREEVLLPLVEEPDWRYLGTVSNGPIGTGTYRRYLIIRAANIRRQGG